MEIIADPSEDGLGQFVLVALATELLFLFRVRNVGRFDKNRRHIRRFQHQESRLLDSLPMHTSDLDKLIDDVLANVEARAQRGILSQIEKHGREYRILTSQ